jgi:hypothetical protein
MVQAGKSRARDPIKWINFFSVCIILAWALEFTQPLTEMSIRIRKMFQGSRVRSSVRLTTSQPSASRLPILNILNPYRPSRPITGIILLFYYYYFSAQDENSHPEYMNIKFDEAYHNEHI